VGTSERFDSVTRILGSGMSRRKAIKYALGGAMGLASTGAVIAVQQGTAGAQCNPGCGVDQQCCTTNVSPAAPFCAPDTAQCCGNQACLPPQQCCTTAVPNFCAPPDWAAFCCGRFACVIGVTQCCTTGTEPHCEPASFTCCGNTSCGPGYVCQGYPSPGVCVPV
jgi:hypothetical protein